MHTQRLNDNGVGNRGVVLRTRSTFFGGRCSIGRTGQSSQDDKCRGNRQHFEVGMCVHGSGPAEPVVTLVFPVSARISTGDVDRHDVLGILEAELGWGSQLHGKTVGHRQDLIDKGCTGVAVGSNCECVDDATSLVNKRAEFIVNLFLCLRESVNGGPAKCHGCD